VLAGVLALPEMRGWVTRNFVLVQIDIGMFDRNLDLPRRFGAASLDLAWVAAGRYDGFWESSLKPWDTAAGCLLVREAGGFVSDYRGRSPQICDETVLAANDGLHSRLHKLVATAIRD